MKEDALKLADDLDAMKLFGASGMIRRLVEELDKKPLSIEQINDIHMETNGNINPIDFAKGIERAHGIK